MSIAGPHIMILGTLLVDMTIVEPLTEMISLGGHDLENRVLRVAKIFHVLAECLADLRTYYAELSPSNLHDADPHCNVKHWLPYITSYERTEIRYISRLLPLELYPDRAIFEAERVSDGWPLLVKFVESGRYSADAHRLLADDGLAPRLYHCGKIPGGSTMVVMDRVADSQDARASCSIPNSDCAPLPVSV